MADRTVNVLLTSFPGLGLPQTLTLPIKASTSIADLTSHIQSRIPDIQSRLILTTPRNKQLLPSSPAPISTLIPDNETILPLRLSAPLCGGKGGFGSQLRAAGGRMSSKRKKTVGDPNASSRNLDGRRLRTVTEAKALAEYLATKPEMERREKEKRRERWEQVVEQAERRQEEIRKGGSQGRVDGKWVEDKDEAGERTREAVRAAMASGNFRDVTFAKEGDGSASVEKTSSEEEDSEEGGADGEAGSVPTSPEEAVMVGKGKGKAKEASKAYFGWDEDDEFMSDDDEEEEESENDAGKDEVIEPALLTASAA